jgi:hypothetical protein
LLSVALRGHTFEKALSLLTKHGANINCHDAEYGSLVALLIHFTIDRLNNDRNYYIMGPSAGSRLTYKEYVLQEVNTYFNQRWDVLSELGACFANDKEKADLMQELNAALDLYGAESLQSLRTSVRDMHVLKQRLFKANP